MILFIDSEWADVLATELVSLALVSDCGRFEFYAERDPLPSSPTNFVRSVVYPLLERGEYACSDADFTHRLHAFIASVARVARYGGVTVAYDHRNDLDLLNYALDGFEEQETPARPQFRPYNLGWMGDQYVKAVEECFARDSELSRRRHHALIDARANRDAYRMMTAGASLRKSDPDLADKAAHVLGSEEKAAAWWTYRSVALGGKSASQIHAEGGRERLLEQLDQIRYGIPP